MFISLFEEPAATETEIASPGLWNQKWMTRELELS